MSLILIILCNNLVVIVKKSEKGRTRDKDHANSVQEFEDCAGDSFR